MGTRAAMNAEHDTQARTGSVLIAEVFPGNVDAGAELTVRAMVSGAPQVDLRGQPLVIEDHNGNVLGRTEFTEFDNDISRVAPVTAKAPEQTGEYTWRAIMPADDGDDPAQVKAAVPVSFTVRPHAIGIVVWDMPDVVEIGQEFTLKVGFKCSAGCPLTDAAFSIHDDAGAQLAAGAVPDRVWQGTSGLNFAEVTLTAPQCEGRFQWQVRADAPPGSDLPHTEGSANFGFRVVPVADCEVIVEIVDAEKQTPVESARVQMHPYRAVADESGRARFRVAKGAYKVVASGRNYISNRTAVEVDGDATVRIELTFEPPDDEKLWMWA
jgi:hypothetical protein